MPTLSDENEESVSDLNEEMRDEVHNDLRPSKFGLMTGLTLSKNSRTMSERVDSWQVAGSFQTKGKLKHKKKSFYEDIA